MGDSVFLAAQYITAKYGGAIDCAIILGSGLGQWGDTLADVTVIPYSDVPGMPVSSVLGHSNCFIIGKKSGKTVLAMKGRIHLYEGHDAGEVIFPVRVMKLLNINKLIITNAAGGVNTDYKPGDLMLINDHINLSGHNCLRGQEALQFGERFPSMSAAYDRALLACAQEAAGNLGIMLRNGVYFYCTGPSFETPAEIKAIRLLGGDAVGMSTVHEATAAVQQGMHVLGISCITNMAAGILDMPLTHQEVIETGKRVQHKFGKLIDEIIRLI